MFRNRLLQAARLQPLRPHHRSYASSNLGSGNGNKPPSKAQARARDLLNRWIHRSPKFFRSSLISLRDAPGSSIVAFLILHELTALAPLGVLTAGFHYYGWLPPYFPEGKTMVESVEKFGKWFKKKGWINEKDEALVEETARQGEARLFESTRNDQEITARLLLEIATAYVVVKAMLPVRIALSVWWAPGFARVLIVPVKRAVTAIMK